MATSMTSEGLSRWGHFSSSKRSVDLDEPIYLNQWIININAADLPAGLGASQDDVNIILEGVRAISGFETQPGLGNAVTQKYKHAERGYAGGAPSKTHLDLQLTFELNLRRDGNTDDNYTYKFLRKWCDLIYDPLTGHMSIKQNYVCRGWTVTLMDKEGIGFHQWYCQNIFPTSSLPHPSLTYDGGDIWKSFQMTFWCDTFDEIIS